VLAYQEDLTSRRELIGFNRINTRPNSAVLRIPSNTGRRCFERPARHLMSNRTSSCLEADEKTVNETG
jgi:hypothetical protein